MATLQVKNLPDELHAALVRRASAERTTLSDYVTQVLRRDLAYPTMREWADVHGGADGAVRPIDVAAALDAVRVELDPEPPAEPGPGRPSTDVPTSSHAAAGSSAAPAVDPA